MTIYIFSTLTASQNYATSAGNVLVHGGANLQRAGTLDTPRGVATPITDEQYKLLRDENEVFKLHMKNGFIAADNRKNDADEVAQDMTGADASAQKTEASLTAEKDLQVKASNKNNRK